MISKTKNINLFFFIKASIFFISIFLIFKNIETDNLNKLIIDNFHFQNLYNFIFIFLISSLLIFIQIYVNFITTLKKIKNFSLSYIFYARLFLNSQLLSFIIPHFGFLFRALRLNRKGLPFTDFIAINYFLAWFYLWFFLIFYSFEILFFFNLPIFYNYIFFIIGLFISLSIFFIPNLFLKLNFINLSNLFLKTIHNKLIYIFSISKEFKKNNFFLVLSFYGLISHIFSFLLIFLVTKYLNLELLFSQILIFFVVNSFLDQVPITPKNIGISELFFGIIGSSLGLGFEVGILIKITLRIFYCMNLIFYSILLNITNLKNNFN